MHSNAEFFNLPGDKICTWVTFPVQMQISQWAGRRTLKNSKIWQKLFCIEILPSNKSFVILTRESGRLMSFYPLINPLRYAGKHFWANL